jgi:hypothetical protein
MLGKVSIVFVVCHVASALSASSAQHAVAVVPNEQVTDNVCSMDEGGCDAGPAKAAADHAIFEPTHEWKEILPNQHIPGVRSRIIP